MTTFLVVRARVGAGPEAPAPVLFLLRQALTDKGPRGLEGSTPSQVCQLRGHDVLASRAARHRSTN